MEQLIKLVCNEFKKLGWNHCLVAQTVWFTLIYKPMLFWLSPLLFWIHKKHFLCKANLFSDKESFLVKDGRGDSVASPTWNRTWLFVIFVRRNIQNLVYSEKLKSKSHGCDIYCPVTRVLVDVWSGLHYRYIITVFQILTILSSILINMFRAIFVFIDVLNVCLCLKMDPSLEQWFWVNRSHDYFYQRFYRSAMVYCGTEVSVTSLPPWQSMVHGSWSASIPGPRPG